MTKKEKDAIESMVLIVQQFDVAYKQFLAQGKDSATALNMTQALFAAMFKGGADSNRQAESGNGFMSLFDPKDL